MKLSATIGTDQVDMEFAASLGIPVFNAPFASTRSVAEIVLSCIIGLARGLSDCSSAMHQVALSVSHCII
jgi:D-3-phosphoglycerate dehydrogenase / 2-oxoglutarate reductase